MGTIDPAPDPAVLSGGIPSAAPSPEESVAEAFPAAADTGEGTDSPPDPLPTTPLNGELEVEVMTAEEAERRFKAAAKTFKGRKLAKRVTVPARMSNVVERLDSSTAQTWLLVVRARQAGLNNQQISEATDIDESLIDRLVMSPVFMGFEASYRRVMAATPELDVAAQRLTAMIGRALDALDYWVGMREKDLAQASLAAAKMILSASGIDTERKRINKSVVRIDVSDEFSKRLKKAGEE